MSRSGRQTPDPSPDDPTEESELDEMELDEMEREKLDAIEKRLDDLMTTLGRMKKLLNLEGP